MPSRCGQEQHYFDLFLSLNHYFGVDRRVENYRYANCEFLAAVPLKTETAEI